MTILLRQKSLSQVVRQIVQRDNANKLYKLINFDMKRFGSSTWIPDNGEFEVIIGSVNTLSHDSTQKT